MSAGGFSRAVGTLAVGHGIAGALLWALLNVPESNVFSLTASVFLLVLACAVAGITTATAAASIEDVALWPGGRSAVRALPRFMAGMLLLAILWQMTGSAKALWQAHRGEVDALFLRYLGVTRTQPLHQGMFWALWLVRWVVGLSVVVGLLVTRAVGTSSAAARGLRVSVRPMPLLAAAVGTLVVTQGLWRMAYWRPAGLPATAVEIVFAAAKLGVLYVLAAAVGAAVLGVYLRAAAQPTGDAVDTGERRRVRVRARSRRRSSTSR